MKRRDALALLTLGLPACAGGGHLTRDAALRDVARRFALHVRWKKWRGAATMVHPAYRAKWLASRAATRHVHLTDVAVIGIQPAPDNETATVLLGVSWYRIPSTQIQQRAWQQTWRYEARQWFLVEEKLPEVPVAPADEPASAWP